MALVVVLSSQRLHHYILMHKTKVVANSNPMQYILGQQLITGKFAWWIIILQEFNLDFSSPKTKKGLALVEFITSFPTGNVEPPINHNLPNEHLFLITTKDPWYGDILTYIRTQKIAPHLTHDNQRCNYQQAPHYLLIDDILYHKGVDIILHRCLTHREAKKVLNDFHVGAYGDHLFGMATT